MTVYTAATAARRAGAASHEEVDWHAVNWQQVNQDVRRLQARIVKAQKEGRRGKVKALQHLLTHSFSGKALAVRRVTENQGKRTPGVDGIIWDTPAKKATAVCRLRRRGYRPRPLRRIYIPKKNGKKRPLGIPTMADRAMQALYVLALDPIAETTGDLNSYGFRRGRSTADAIAQCFKSLVQQTSAEWVLEGDIKSCFDRISHEWLLTHVPMDRAILQKWLKAGFMDRQGLHPTEDGTPQGGIVSPVLANLALDGLECRLREALPVQVMRNGIRRSNKVNLIRYADDFVITGRSREQLETEVLPLVAQFMAERGLELSPEKTRITHIDDGFDFLGQNVRKYKGKLLIKPSKESIKSLLADVRGIIKANKQATAGQLILRLNPVIRGWAQYHQHVVSSDTFRYIEHQTFKALWHWAKRRHPKKGSRWVKDKYFHRVGGLNWVFSGEHDGQMRRLFSAASVPIRRHVKVAGVANPYDLEWAAYFEHRRGVKMSGLFRGQRTLLYLWKRQRGLCLRCHQPITDVTGWYRYQLPDGVADRVLLHPTCYRELPRSESVSTLRPIPGRS